MIRPIDPAARAGRLLAFYLILSAMGTAAALAGEPDAYLTFVRARGVAVREGDAPPKSIEEWNARRAEIRRRMNLAMGTVPDPPPPLDPVHHGTLDRDGYRVEKWTFQTMPGVRMTANLYVPDGEGPHPAVLSVHGHFAGAKQDPTVQTRCIAMARLGFVVLSVDAFGAGERGVGKALGEYHGEMTAATLFPAGLTLAGLQVYENSRALAFLATRPEVDANRVGVTGASGGGNQTMYAISLIDGLKVGVPVCSVGNYHAYLGAACCLCEVVPGALTFTDEWGVLGQAAPKPLMIVNATRDAPQFSVAEARKTLAGLEPLYRLHDRTANLRHTLIESGHGYNKEMREAAYGWFARQLKGQGDGSPIPEPELKTEDPEALRCFPGETRPDDFITLPQYAAAVGRKLLESRPIPSNVAAWKADADRRRSALGRRLGMPPTGKSSAGFESERNHTSIEFEPEPGIRLLANVGPARGREASRDRRPFILAVIPDVGPARGREASRAILLDLEGAAHAKASPIAGALHKAGWSVVTLDLRATGQQGPSRNAVGQAPDHNSAEWGLWIGRPLLGQWVTDVRRLLDAMNEIERRETAVIGIGPAGLVALAAGAVEPRIKSVAAIGTISTLVSDRPYRGQRLGTIVPGMLVDVGDVAHLAALAAPRRVVIAGGVGPDGKPMDGPSLRDAYDPAARVFGLLGSEGALRILDLDDPAQVERALW